MFEIEKIVAKDKRGFYKEVNSYLEALLEGESDWMAGISMPLLCYITPWRILTGLVFIFIRIKNWCWVLFMANRHVSG